jgi:hypothetical protein
MKSTRKISLLTCFGVVAQLACFAAVQQAERNPGVDLAAIG